MCPVYSSLAWSPTFLDCLFSSPTPKSSTSPVFPSCSAKIENSGSPWVLLAYFDFFKKRFIHAFFCVCASSGVHKFMRVPSEAKCPRRSLEQKLQKIVGYPTWVLRIDLQSFARAASALNTAIISVAMELNLLITI